MVGVETKAGSTDAPNIRSKLRCGDLGQIIKLHGEVYEPLGGYGLRFEAFVGRTIAEFILDNDARGQIWLAERDDRLVGCTAVVLRDGEEKTYQVTLGRLEEADGQAEAKAEPKAPAENETLGLSLSSLNDVLREQYNVEDGLDGVLVVAVVPGSQAAEKRVRAGDVIVKVAQKAVTDPEEVEEQVARAKSEGLKSVLLQISRGGETSFVALRVEGS